MFKTLIAVVDGERQLTYAELEAARTLRRFLNLRKSRLPALFGACATDPTLDGLALRVASDWLARIPGRTIAAIMSACGMSRPTMNKARHTGFARLTQKEVSASAARHEMLYSGRPGGARAVFAFCSSATPALLR